MYFETGCADLNHLKFFFLITDLNHLHRLVCYGKNVYGVLCIMFKNNKKKLK